MRGTVGKKVNMGKRLSSGMCLPLPWSLCNSISIFREEPHRVLSVPSQEALNSKNNSARFIPQNSLFLNGIISYWVYEKTVGTRYIAESVQVYYRWYIYHLLWPACCGVTGATGFRSAKQSRLEGSGASGALEQQCRSAAVLLGSRGGSVSSFRHEARALSQLSCLCFLLWLAAETRWCKLN